MIPNFMKLPNSISERAGFLSHGKGLTDGCSLSVGAVCLQPFCHLYWGCTRTGCFGCLAPFCGNIGS